MLESLPDIIFYGVIYVFIIVLMCCTTLLILKIIIMEWNEYKQIKEYEKRRE